MNEGKQRRVQLEDNLCSLAVNPVLSYFVTAYVQGVPIQLMVDTGAAVSLLGRDVWNMLSRTSNCSLEQWSGGRLVGVEGSSVPVHGMTTMDIQLQGQMVSIDFVVVEMLKVESLMGLDFLEKNNCVIDLSEKVLQFKGVQVPLSIQAANIKHCQIGCVNVSLLETVTIPPFSEVETLANTELGERDGGIWLLEGREHPNLSVLVAAAVVSPLQGDALCSVPIRMVNPLSTEVVVHKGTKIATVEKMDEWMLAPIQLTETAAEEIPEVPMHKQDVLHEIAEQCGVGLTVEEKSQLFHLLLAYADVFADAEDGLGRTGVVKHSIVTGDNPPIKQPCRRVPPTKREHVRQLVQDMLKKDVVQPSSSPWASPIVVVQKKDGSYRFCVDYRKINTITRKDAYPLPRIDDTIEALSGSQWFSTLDLLWGYWQVEMSEEDRAKTAFSTHEGLYEFKVMPFGLCNAPATFQRLMDLVLSGIQWSSCLVYIDDIVVVGKTVQNHLDNLQLVLDRIKRAGLRLKPSKCHLFQKEILYLGHRITRDGVATDPGKIDAVRKWAVPRTVQEVQTFLGLVGYYRKFVNNFAATAKPLYRLTERGREFNWTTECEAAFLELKSRLVSAPILAFPDFTKMFILDTDASQSGVGAVLSQLHDGQERVVAYASRVLSKAERQYSVTRKELLAVVTFAKHFRHYLLGRHFVVRTDHSSLQWLYNFKEPEGQTARWLESLQEFDFEVIHRSGRNHTNADALSRCDTTGEDEVKSHNVDAVTVSKDPVHFGNMHELQEKDEAIGPVLRAMHSGTRVRPADIQGRSRECCQLAEQWDQLKIVDGILHRRHEDANGRSHLQVVAPKVSRSDIMHHLHDGIAGGHLGEAKTLSRLRERFYWPGHASDVRMWCKTCSHCAARKNPTHTRRAPLQSMLAGYPMQIVAVDIVGPFPSGESGNTYVLVASDYFSRWVEAYGIPNQEAVTVATKLVDELFCRFSIPEQIHSDQGRQFESNLVQEICKLLHVNKTRTTPYHPQSDGLVERFNRTLISMLATTVHELSVEWDKCLKKVCMAYNTSVHPSTGFTPFFLMFGRQAKLPLDIIYGSTPTDPQPVHEYAKNLKRSLEDAYSRVREHLGTTVERQKEVYESKVHGKPFEIGDLVWLHNPVVGRGMARKLHCPWSGPFKIIKKLSSVVYRIQDTRRARKNRKVVHFDRLKPCPENTRLDDSRPEIRSQTEPGVSDVLQKNRFPGHQLQLMDDDGAESEPENAELDHRVVAPMPREQQIEPDNLPADPGAGEGHGQPEPRYPTRDRRPPSYYGRSPYS